MTLSSVKSVAGLTAESSPSGTSVRNKVLIGEESRVVGLPDASIAYSFLVQAAAPGNIATLTCASGVVAQTAGSPIITDGDGKDWEGVTLPDTDVIYAVIVRVTVADTTSISVGGTLGPGGLLKGVGDVVHHLSVGGISITSQDVSLTFGTGNGAAKVTVIGKEA